MSFYGNIQNRIDRFFRFIRIKNSNPEEDNVLQAEEENDIFTLSGNNGIQLNSSTDDYGKLQIDISGENLIEDIDELDSPEKVQYTFKQGGKTIKQINIPKSTETIKISVTDNKITANVKEESIQSKHLDLDSIVEYSSGILTLFPIETKEV